MKKGGLGRGLDSLFEGFDTKEILDEKVAELRVSEIEPNRNQPRKEFSKQALLELSESVATHGVMQPIVVRRLEDTYQIIAGERRWRASRMAGLKKVPVVVMEIDDKTAAELALVENLQRQDLNPVEEATGYKNLIESYGLTQEEVAKRVGKSRSTVSNSLRLLNLPDDALSRLESNEMSVGHGKLLLRAIDEGKFAEVCKMITSGASVRAIEQFLGKKSDTKQTRKPAENTATKVFVSEAQQVLSGLWGKSAKIKPLANGRGKIEISYRDKAHLEEILGQIMGDGVF